MTTYGGGWGRGEKCDNLWWRVGESVKPMVEGEREGEGEV